MNSVIERDNEVRPSLAPTEFWDIIAYMYYLNYNSEPGRADRGKEVFSSKGCIQCHALEPPQAEGKPGKAVYEMGDFSSAVTLAVAVWNHGTSMVQRMSQQNMRWPEFDGREVADLVEFVRFRTGSSVSGGMVVPGDTKRGSALFNSKGCINCHRSGAKTSNTRSRPRRLRNGDQYELAGGKAVGPPIPGCRRPLHPAGCPIRGFRSKRWST